jgi:protein ImuA
MDTARDLYALRHTLAALAPLVDTPSALFPLGAEPVDRALGGGLGRGALHEIFPLGAGDGAAATGFAIALACRAGGGGRPLVWVRERKASETLGHVYAQGLAEFGLNPEGLTLVAAPDTVSALRAGHEASRCAALGAVILEIHGAARGLDHTATRRLSLATEESGVPVFLLRIGAVPQTSAARSRWLIAARASQPAERTGLLGRPAFWAEIDKHRTVPRGTGFLLEWDHAGASFAVPALPGAVVSPVHDRPAAPARRGRRAAAG